MYKVTNLFEEEKNNWSVFAFYKLHPPKLKQVQFMHVFQMLVSVLL